MKANIICDTSIWLYLGGLGQASLLRQLYDTVFVTETVCWELDNGRLNRPSIFNPRDLSWVFIVQPTQQEIANLPANRLGPGERSALAYARTHQLDLVGLDDHQAREVAQYLGLRTIGTVGILLRAKQAGLLTAVRPFLISLQQEGFRISRTLVDHILLKAGEM